MFGIVLSGKVRFYAARAICNKAMFVKEIKNMGDNMKIPGTDIDLRSNEHPEKIEMVGLSILQWDSKNDERFKII